MTSEGSRRNIRLRIAYDGTDFSGWQRQIRGKGEQRTVQGAIEAALERLHHSRVNLTGSGRTDAGVHAAGQVANFYTSIQNMAAERFVPALNSLLPRDVRILESREAAASFHARFDARYRTYRYQLISGRPALPQESRYSLPVRRRLRLDLLNGYARLLRGETDCSPFASARDPSPSRSRYIAHTAFFVQGDMLIFEIRANAFLWKMVRSLVGTLLFYEERRLPPEAFKALLASADRRRAGPTAPPQGLWLWNIEYYREKGASIPQSWEGPV